MKARWTKGHAAINKVVHPGRRNSGTGNKGSVGDKGRACEHGDNVPGKKPRVHAVREIVGVSRKVKMNRKGSGKRLIRHGRPGRGCIVQLRRRVPGGAVNGQSSWKSAGKGIEKVFA